MQQAAKSPGPLAGIRVLDLSTVVMGPYAGRILADYGADVIKVESPEGDIMRLTGPGRHRGMGAVYLHLNRGKRGVVLDLKKKEARDALLRLATNADVLLHNIRPEAMRRLALAYDDVAAVNGKIIYVSLVGYAQDGPYAARPAYDDLIQGACGIAWLFARTGSEVPRYVPVNMADRITGITAVHAIIAALFHRERTGQGQALEVPMFETMTEFVMSEHLGGHTFEPPIGPFGYQRLLTPHRRPHRTADGYICVLVYNEPQFERFFTLAGKLAEYHADERLCNPILRRDHYDAVYRIIADIIATRTTADWLQALEQSDIPAMPLHDMDSLLADPHLQATGFFEEVEHPSEGWMRTMARTTKFGACEQPPLRHAPALGEHTAEVLNGPGGW